MSKVPETLLRRLALPALALALLDSCGGSSAYHGPHYGQPMPVYYRRVPPRERHAMPPPGPAGTEYATAPATGPVPTQPAVPETDPPPPPSVVGPAPTPAHAVKENVPAPPPQPKPAPTPAPEPTVTQTSGPEAKPATAASVPTGTKVPSRPGRAKSPYPPYRELDVTGLPSGSLAKDPVSGKVFRVP